MTAVPGVPVEAIEAAYTRFCEREHLRGGHRRDDMMAAILAALPSLREVIAAEVLPETVESKGGGVYFMPHPTDVAEAWELVAEAAVDELDEAALFSDYVRAALERTRAEVLAPVRALVDEADRLKGSYVTQGAVFTYKLRAALSAPVQAAEPEASVASLDGTDDAADWITAGHVLDPYEVAFLRSLVLPKGKRDE